MDLIIHQNPRSLKTVSGGKLWHCSGIAKMQKRFCSFYMEYRSFQCLEQAMLL
jgi:hypothetical protein